MVADFKTYESLDIWKDIEIIINSEWNTKKKIYSWVKEGAFT
jgi:hypothetical protein